MAQRVLRSYFAALTSSCPFSPPQRLCTKLEGWRQRLNEIRMAAADSVLAPTNSQRLRLEEKAEATKEVLSNIMDKLTVRR